MAEFSAPARAAMVGAMASLLEGGTVHVVTEMGEVISAHAVSGVRAAPGVLLIETGPSVATGSGRAARFDILADGGTVARGGTLALDHPDIDEGSDIVLDPIRLEA